MEQILNYIDNQWRPSKANDYLDVRNPATQEIMARTPLSLAGVVDEAALAAWAAFPAWRRTPVTERVQYLV